MTFTTEAIFGCIVITLLIISFSISRKTRFHNNIKIKNNMIIINNVIKAFNIIIANRIIM